MDLAILVAASIEFQSLIGRFVMLHIDAFRKLINVSIPDRKVRNFISYDDYKLMKRFQSLIGRFVIITGYSCVDTIICFNP